METTTHNDATSELNLSLEKTVDLVVLAVKDSAIRCKILDSGIPITLRKVRFEVEGEILTVNPSKIWTYRKTHYISGDIVSKRIDVPALKLKPLELRDEWDWKPEEHYWGEYGDEIEPYFEPIFKFGPRKSYEMEQVLPGEDPEDFDCDPIIEASECHQCGDYKTAYKIMENILTTYLRCLDAHAHLGIWEFNNSDKDYDWSDNPIEKAKKHYEVGVKIGELSLGKGFNGLLPWGRLDNRPFLRCLVGYGLSQWRLGAADKAKEVFTRMLWLNPTDNQGVRFLLEDIDEGKSWYERSEL